VSVTVAVLSLGAALSVVPAAASAAGPVGYAGPARQVTRTRAINPVSQQFTSRNWDGYITYASSHSTDFNSVTATWVQPTVTCDSANAWTVFWVGLDGWWNNTVEQGGGPASLIGGVIKTFTLPQDTDNVVVKFQASILGGGASVTFQTTDDGGTTWYDVQRSSIISNANANTAEFMSIPVISAGNNLQSSIVAVGSVVTNVGTIGSSAASTLGVGEVSGLPILSQQGRIFIRYGAAITSIISERVKVMVNSQAGNR